MRRVKGFSYDTERDKDVIEHIGKQPNQCQYVWGLVRKDMGKKDNIKEIVKKYVEEILKNKNVEIKNTIVSKKDINQLLDIK